MKIRIIINVLLLILILFSISSCSNNNNENNININNETIQIYNFNSDKYFVAYATTSTPSLENFEFDFPIITDKEINDIKEIKFYFEDKEIELDSIVIDEIFDYHMEINDEKFNYLYSLRTTINKKNINDSLYIDKIIMKINDNLYTFNVDVKIHYQYIQSDYNTYISIFYSDCDSQGIDLTFYFNCFPAYNGNKKITKISGNILDLDNTYTASILDINENSFNIKDFIIPKNANYYLNVKLKDITTFVSDAIEVTIDYDGTEITYCSNNNMITCSIAEFIAMNLN